MSTTTIQQTQQSQLNQVQQRRPELIASWLYQHFSSWRSLIGLVAIAVLTGISVTFNYQLGKLMGSDEITKGLFPMGFATLDLATLFLASWLTRKSRSIIRKFIAWCWFAFLVSLSVWAAMSFTLASDARLAQSGYEQMKESKLKALEQAEQQVQAAQVNYEKTIRYKKFRLADLREAQQRRDALMAQVDELNQATPHVSLAIYYRTSALLHETFKVDIAPHELSGLIRMVWALALTLSPFILTGLIAFELSSTSKVSHAKFPREKNRFSPGENRKLPVKFVTSKWKNFDPKAEQKSNKKSSTIEEALRTVKVANSNLESQGRALFPELSEQMSETRNVGPSAVLNLDALAKVRNWLKTQQGRVTREKIKYRAGNLKYDDISLIIAELEKEGSLIRMGNGQLKAKPNLRVVG